MFWEGYASVSGFCVNDSERERTYPFGWRRCVNIDWCVFIAIVRSGVVILELLANQFLCSLDPRFLPTSLLEVHKLVSGMQHHTDAVGFREIGLRIVFVEDSLAKFDGMSNA